MRDIVVVGAAGYIGARLLEHFSRNAVDWYTGFDLGIFGQAKMPKQTYVKDVADIPASAFKDKVVIYLASFHREPDGTAHREAWRQAYDKLMVREPARIARACHQLIYVSSMRAITDRVSLYGETKARAEKVLLDIPNTRQVRFGTIWGDLNKRLPNRPNTAVNYALTRGQFSGDHWEAFTTHIDDAIDWLSDTALVASSPSCPPDPIISDIVNIVDLPVPLTADDMRSLLKQQHKNRALQQQFICERSPTSTALDLREDQKAARCLQDYYGLETPNAK